MKKTYKNIDITNFINSTGRRGGGTGGSIDSTAICIIVLRLRASINIFNTFSWII